MIQGNHPVRWSSATCIALALFAMSAMACNRPVPQGVAGDASATSAVALAPSTRVDAAAVPGVLPAGDVVLGASIYDLRTRYVDQEGAARHLDVFRGHPAIVAMFFSTCPLACPRLIANVKKLEESLAPAERADLRVLLVTIDPETDTPAILRAVVKDRQLDAARWKLFTGKDDDIRDAAAVLGIKYRETDGTLNHSSVLTLVDRDGHMVARYDGLADARLTAGPRIRDLVANKP